MAFTSVATTLAEEPSSSIPLIGADKGSLSHATSTLGKIVPIEHGKGSGVDFGAEVYGIDLNKLTDADFDFISDALHRHKLLVFKEQPEMLTPQQQYLLTSR